MKLLGWMHRKFRQNSNEPFKDFSIGNSCGCLTGQASLDDLQYHPKPNYCSKPLIKPPTDNQLRKSFASTDTARIDEEELEDQETPATLSDLFHGFLAIGTLGTDPVITDPSTPTFSISVENIMEKETEVTENELKLINDELERVLGADESCNVSSGRNSHVSTGRNSYVSTGRNSHVSTGRNSHVSTGRSSHCSTITLSGKPIDSTENIASGTIICPLQGYLLGSAIGLLETTSAAAKRENRTSLGELFQRTKLTEENSGAKSDRGEKKMETDKSAVFLVKKMLKKRILNASIRCSAAASGGTTDSASAETKLQKILHIFHRKVHPESSAASQKSNKPAKFGVKRRVSHEHERPYIIEGSETTDEHITIIPRRALSNESIRRFKSQSNPTQLMLNGASSFGIGEHWIKTDSDYLVLEL